jgi:sulfoxide reductase heme-binding subunit YedZ
VSWDSATRVRYVAKPAVFALCLLPLALLVARVAGYGGSLGPNPVEEILNTLGKWGLNFLFLTLCITPLRQLTGWIHFMRFRRMLGLFAFFYVLLHVVFYATVDQSLDWRILVEDVSKRPYITLGMLALLLLVPLAATSTQRAMRRLGRRWQRLHRLVYVVALLGCIHYYWQVKADVREPLLYFAALVVLLGWRWRRYRAQRRTAMAAASRSMS